MQHSMSGQRSKYDMHYADLMEASSDALIAYHGTGSRIIQFHQNTVTPHYFTQDKEYAKGYVGGKTSRSLIDPPKKGRNYLLTVELDIRHMLDTKHDAEARAFYNTQFLPHINAIHARFHKPPLPPIEAGYVSFINADYLYRYCLRFPSAYDGMLVDEGGITNSPAIVPFHASQIRVLKAEIVRFE